MKDTKFCRHIHSLRLAGYLMYNGIRIQTIHHNLKVRDKDVYLFEESERLDELIREYCKLKHTKGMIK